MDMTKPNISRIYDYVLGGHHNFEIDRMAAEQIMKVFPAYPHWAKLNRWFLQMVAGQWVELGHQHILDLGSGMPTQGNVHEIATEAQVLYCDRDSVTVAYAQELLQNTTNVRYIEADVSNPQPILQAAAEFFGGERRVAIGCIGLAYFLDDTTLSGLMQALHDWAAPGSVMALSQAYGEIRNDDNQATTDAFKRSGAQLFPRDEAAVRRIMAPWEVREFKPLATWLNMGDMLDDSDRAGGSAEMFGVILERAR